MTTYINGVQVVAPEQVRDALLSLPDNERGFVLTDPEAGEHKIYEVHRNAAGNLEGNYEDIPE